MRKRKRGVVTVFWTATAMRDLRDEPPPETGVFEIYGMVWLAGLNLTIRPEWVRMDFNQNGFRYEQSETFPSDSS